MEVIKPEVLTKVGFDDEVKGDSPEVMDLVGRAKTGDAEAFAGLMRLHERQVITLGIQMGLSREDARDACQDAFLKVFKYIRGFHSERSFFKWLYRIALNTIADHRRKARHPVILSLDESAIDQGHERHGTGSAWPQDRIEVSDLARKLMAALDLLSRRERIVFVLRDIQEMGTEEIGAILGLSQVTVRRHSMLARRKLRERLSPARV